MVRGSYLNISSHSLSLYDVAKNEMGWACGAYWLGDGGGGGGSYLNKSSHSLCLYDEAKNEMGWACGTYWLGDGGGAGIVFEQILSFFESVR